MSFKISASPGGSQTAENVATGDLIGAVDVSAGASDNANVYRLYTEELKLWTAALMPQGRLTLVSGTPVLTSDQTAKTAIYYTPYIGDRIRLYDATNGKWIGYDFAELTLTLDSTNHASGSLYDVFVWNNSGTISIGTGPAWSSTTSRGTGAATTEIERKNGVWTNKVSITLKNGAGSGTSGVAANTALYVGTFYATGNGQTGMTMTPSPAAGGNNSILGLFNAYNRVLTPGKSSDNTSSPSTSYTYASATWRASNNSSSNRVSYVDGLGEVSVDAMFQQYTNAATSGLFLGMSRDSTSATPSVFAGSTSIGTKVVTNAFAPSLGFHYIQAQEYAASSGSFVTDGSYCLRLMLQI